MPLEPASMLGHYRLVEKIGEGGMGVVWKALDTTLGREVALKLLPESVADDPERLSRFRREARLLAGMNHPGLATVHGLHEAAGVRFLAMELVPGEDLAQRLARGRLPTAEVIRIGAEIAAAMEAAHLQGVVHRDLKPDNVRITPAGSVKVLDLGLALALDDRRTGEAGGSLSPTMTTAGTRAGIVLGTAAYMSPEQARGDNVDRRADVWSFGVILWEMLVGGLLFQQRTLTDTLAAVLKGEIDWDRLPSDTPPALSRLLRRCLSRELDGRLRDFGDVRLELEEARREPEEAPRSASVRRGPVAFLRPALWALAASLATAAVVWQLRPAPPPPLVERLTLEAPEIQSAYNNPAVVSPDGRRIVYFRERQLWLQELDRLHPRPIPGTEGAYSPFFSPDSQWLGFIAGGYMSKVPLGGGESAVVARVPGGLYSGYGGGASWSERGTIVFATGSGGLQTVPQDGGALTELLAAGPGELDLHDPCWLPGERGIVYVVHRAAEGMDTLGMYDGRRSAVLLRHPGEVVASPVYSHTGHVLYLRIGQKIGIWALPLDPDSLAASGDPFPVLEHGGRPSVSDDGSIVTILGSGVTTTQVAIVGPDGRVVRAVGGAIEMRFSLSLSPDARRVAYSGGPDEDLWTLDLETGTDSRLTFETGEVRLPRWSPDGRSVVYQCFDGEVPSVCIIGSDGAGERRIVGAGLAPAFTPDGREVVYYAPGAGGAHDVVRRGLQPGAEPVTVVQGVHDGSSLQVSPRGDYLVYEGANATVLVTRFPSGEGRWQVGQANAGQPIWSRDGSQIFYVQVPRLMVVDVDRSAGFVLGPPRPVFERLDPDVVVGPYTGLEQLPGGGEFLMIRNVTFTGEPPRLVLLRHWL